MKIRNGFVSNSSSCSFVIFNKSNPKTFSEVCKMSGLPELSNKNARYDEISEQSFAGIVYDNNNEDISQLLWDNEKHGYKKFIYENNHIKVEYIGDHESQMSNEVNKYRAKYVSGMLQDLLDSTTTFEECDSEIIKRAVSILQKEIITNYSY